MALGKSVAPGLDQHHLQAVEGVPRRARQLRPAHWAGWLAMKQAAGHPALVYADNTMVTDHALHDAQALAALLGAGAARPA